MLKVYFKYILNIFQEYPRINSKNKIFNFPWSKDRQGHWEHWNIAMRPRLTTYIFRLNWRSHKNPFLSFVSVVKCQSSCSNFQKPSHSDDVLSVASGAIRKVKRCKFCRSKAKYLPGQRSLDAVSAKLFRRKKSPEPSRRAASEDR